MKNVEQRSLGRREMTPVGNGNLCKGMRRTRNGNYMDKCIRFFPYYLKIFKTDCLNKNRNSAVWD